MKTSTLIAAGLSLVALAAFRPLTDYNSLEIGKTVPKDGVKMQDISGKQVSLSDAKRKNGLLVIFSCNTCPFVVKNESRLKAISLYALKSDFGVITVNSNEGQRDGDDSFDAMKKYQAEKEFGGYYVIDKNDEIANAFGASHTPETYLFNKEGVLVYKGAIDDSPRDESSVKTHFLKDALDATVQGHTVKTTSTKSVGCSIKRKDS